MSATILTLIGAVLGAVGTWAIGRSSLYFASLRARRAIAAKIATEMESIVAHHLANIKVLGRHMSGSQSVSITDLRKLIYSDMDFYSTSVSDVTQISPQIAVQLLKFRLTIRNSGIHILEAVQEWPHCSSTERDGFVKILDSRMRSLAKAAEEIRLALNTYIDDPRHDMDLRAIWSDWRIIQDIRKKIIASRSESPTS